MPEAALNIAICDKAPLFAARLQQLAEAALSEIPLSVTAVQTPEQLLTRSGRYDIALLEVQLPGMSGMELSTKLREQNENLQVIFMDSDSRHVSDVYDVPHLGMILKQELEARLPVFLKRAAARLTDSRDAMMTVKNRAGVHQVPTRAILYMERFGHSTKLFLEDGSILSTQPTIDLLLEQSRDSGLLRCHKSYVVNLKHVKGWSAGSFELHDGTIVPISRSHRETSKQAFAAYISCADD